MAVHSETEQKRILIIRFIRFYIRKNKLKPHDKLPSENTLANEFNVSRNVARSALGQLRSQGLIYSLQGKGFFLADKIKPVIYKHQNGTGFSEILNEGVRNYKSEILDFQRGTPTYNEREGLRLLDREEVYRLKILRFFNKHPAIVCTSTLPVKVVPDFEKHLGDFSSVTSILTDKYHYPHPICQNITLKASLPTASETKLLQITESLPILEQVSLFHCEEIGLVEHFTVRARSDCFRFSMSFSQ